MITLQEIKQNESIKALVRRVTQRQRQLPGGLAHASGEGAAGASIATGAGVACPMLSPCSPI